MEKTVFSIVVSFNGAKWIRSCLKSLLASSYPTNILVIDNGSTDATVVIVKNLFPSVRIFETKRNIGFGQANNIGMRIAIGSAADYVFLLNQDATVETGTIEGLVKLQEENPTFGILSPLHFNGRGTALDKNFLDYFTQARLQEFSSSALLMNANLPTLIETNFVNAAAWMINAHCLEKIGGFDPVFFHYGEDRNYTHRALYKGFKIGIDTGTKIYHDREDRVANNERPEARVEKDLIEFLNYVCDIRNPHYRAVVFRRILRHFFSFLKYLALFKKPQVLYHYKITGKIFACLPGIRKSRCMALSGKEFSYL